MAATAVISELFDLVSLSKKAAKESKLNPNDAKTVASVFQKAERSDVWRYKSGLKRRPDAITVRRRQSA